ncbi:MAG: regulatory protein LuxR [Ilumatobacteraceae bacterium]|nr:regulatory protein LuxR [Ilumatobacteraceae bacterium]
MGSAARCGDMFGEVIAAHDGVSLLGDVSDGRMIGVFAKPSEAAAAAIAAQRTFLASRDPQVGVRIALHTAEIGVVQAGSDAADVGTGRAILRASSLSRSGHPGQILVSATTAELLCDALPEGSHLNELGVHFLRELVRPERVVQLVHTTLPERFPPLRTLADAAHAVPTPVTALIGREDELAKVIACVRGGKLVTLTGAGGIGKTRVAQHAAADLVEQHPAGTWWVALGAVSTPEGVLSIIANAIGVDVQPGRPSDAQIVDHLRHAGTVLVVIDNCEHVIDVIAGLVASILASCPSVSILTTSRERLRVRGEQVRQIGPLSAPPVGAVVAVSSLEAFDAATLFIDRARRVRPDLVIDDQAAMRIATICARLDGMPLAIELAAACCATTPLAGIADDLDQALPGISSATRAIPARQSTLHACIAWSFDLLHGSDRALLRRLAVCPTTFGADAAVAIGSDSAQPAAQVLAALGRLIDTSLVEFNVSTGSYRMLQPIRHFALERLREAGEVAETRRRHARYWSARAIEIGTWGRTHDLATLRASLDDVLAMIDWAMVDGSDLADRVLGSIAHTAFGSGGWPDRDRVRDWIIADRPRGPHWPRAVGAVAIAATFVNRRDVLALGQAALHAAHQVEDTTAAHTVRAALALSTWVTGDLDMLRTLVADATAAGDDYPALMAATALVVALSSYGQLEELTACCRLVEEICARAGQSADNTAAGPGACLALHHSGDPVGALARLPSVPSPVQMISLYWAATTARLAVTCNDHHLASRAANLVGPDHLRITSHYAHVVEWAKAITSNDLQQAASSSVAAAATATGLAAFDVLCEQAATLIAAHRPADARAALDRLDQALATSTEPAPLPRASASVLRARLALLDNDVITADRAAHGALQCASEAALRLVQIDALEGVAAVSAHTEQPARAATLLAAASAARNQRHYHGRLTAGAPATLTDHLANTEPTAWRQGTTLTLDDATALARRARGPRGRPAFGPRSLTPTEHNVIAHIATGETNAEIATALHMSTPTVKTHLSRIYTKLNVRNRSELTAYAHTNH